MLRIECTCGKFLKVNESLVGKKIKCPACEAIQLVKKPAAAAKPDQASEKLEERLSPAPKKEKPSGNGSPTNPVSTKRKSPDQGGPPRKPAAKKNNNGMLLLIGGGAVGLLLLVGVAVAGYWLFFGSSTPAPVAKAPTAEPGPVPKAKIETAAIKLFVPHKIGDKREVDVTADLKIQAFYPNLNELPPDMQLQFPSVRMHTNVHLKGVLRTLEVTAKGEETKVDLTIQQFEQKDLSDKMPGANIAPVPAGTMAVGTLGDGSFVWTSPTGSLPIGLPDILSSILLNRYLKEQEANIDRLFGTTKQLEFDGTWPINLAELTNIVKTQVLFKDAPTPGTALKGEVKGNGKLVGFHEEADKQYVDVDIRMDVSQSEGDYAFKLNGLVSARLAREGDTGPIKKVETSDGSAGFKFDVKAGPENSIIRLAMTATFSGTITTHIKYLGNSPIAAPDTNAKPIDAPKKSDKLKAELRDPKIEWVSGQSKVKFSVNVKALEDTKPLDRADYTLYLQFDDGEGGKKLIPVDEPLGGNMLAPTQLFANPALAVTLPAKANPRTCYLVLMEKIPGNPKETEICSVQVSISGAPPTTTPAAENLDIKLSKAKVEHAGKKNNLNFSVDYKVIAGKVDPKKTYRIYVQFEGSNVKQGADKIYEAQGSQLQTQNTITGNFSATISADAKFTMYLRELPKGGKVAQEVNVSDIAAGSVGGVAPLPAAPHFQVNIVAAQRLKTNPKLPPTQMSLQFTWKLTKGQVNKQASYVIAVGPPGAQQPLSPIAGTKFPDEFVYNNQIPLMNGPTLEVSILEILPGQQPRLVSNPATHKITGK